MPFMTNLEEIQHGLQILKQFDDSSGDVCVSEDRFLYAGPRQEKNLDRMPAGDMERLDQLRWQFHETDGRWFYCLDASL